MPVDLLNNMTNRPRNRRFPLALALTLALAAVPAAFAATPAEALQPALSGLAIEKLRVTEVDGIVIVRGRVSTADDYAALKSILDRHGDLRIANMVTIVPIDDAAIARAAERLIGFTRGMEGANLRARSSNGVITLEGTVSEEDQIERAKQLARQVGGVRQVRSLITRG